MTCFETVMTVTKVLHVQRHVKCADFCARLHLAAREASEAK